MHDTYQPTFSEHSEAETFVFIPDLFAKPGLRLPWAYTQQKRHSRVALCQYRDCDVCSLLSFRTVMRPEIEWQIRIEYTN